MTHTLNTQTYPQVKPGCCAPIREVVKQTGCLKFKKQNRKTLLGFGNKEEIKETGRHTKQDYSW